MAGAGVRIPHPSNKESMTGHTVKEEELRRGLQRRNTQGLRDVLYSKSGGEGLAGFKESHHEC